MLIEIKTFTLVLDSGDEIEQVLLQETETGLYFCVDASYVEQEVGDVHSPYGHGVLDWQDHPDIHDPVDPQFTTSVSPQSDRNRIRLS